jgi:hypothetical protein
MAVSGSSSASGTGLRIVFSFPGSAHGLEETAFSCFAAREIFRVWNRRFAKIARPVVSHRPLH